MNKPNGQPICLDSNIIVRTLVPGPDSERADALFKHCINRGDRLVAPSHLMFEVISAIRYYTVQEELTNVEAEEKIELFLKLEIHCSTSKKLLKQAWQLAEQYQRPNIYDTAYIALARMKECDFWTADQTLVSLVNEDLPFVHPLNQFEP